jgi:hypothetical protein
LPVFSKTTLAFWKDEKEVSTSSLSSAAKGIGFSRKTEGDGRKGRKFLKSLRWGKAMPYPTEVDRIFLSP